MAGGMKSVEEEAEARRLEATRRQAARDRDDADWMAAMAQGPVRRVLFQILALEPADGLPDPNLLAFREGCRRVAQVIRSRMEAARPGSYWELMGEGTRGRWQGLFATPANGRGRVNDE